MQTAVVNTPLGLAVITGDAAGISGIHCSKEPLPVSEEVPSELQDCVRQLEEYFSGKRTVFELDLKPAGTAFQQSVWKELMNVPYGHTLSYLTLTRRLGDEKAIRAVASANGRNPIWIVIPCHRIIGSNGSLTGYAGGLWRKQWLLHHERGEQQLSLRLGV